MKSSALAALFAVLVVYCVPSQASQELEQADNKSPEIVSKTTAGKRGSFGLGIGLGRFGFIGESSAAAGLEKNVTGFELYSNYAPNSIVKFELIFQRALIDDQNSFSTIAVGENGFIQFVDSETTARIWTTAVSLNHDFGKKGTEYGLGAGYSFLEIERKIDGCSACSVDSIKLDGGPFVFAQLDFHLGKNSNLGISFSHFLSGDLENSLMLRWKYISNR